MTVTYTAEVTQFKWMDCTFLKTVILMKFDRLQTAPVWDAFGNCFSGWFRATVRFVDDSNLYTHINITHSLHSRWKGSIYKLLWPNLVVYVLLYYILFFVYRFLLDATQQEWVSIIKDTFLLPSLKVSLSRDIIIANNIQGLFLRVV